MPSRFTIYFVLFRYNNYYYKKIKNLQHMYICMCRVRTRETKMLTKSKSSNYVARELTKLFI